ncbi:Cytochrome P450 94A2-like protein [Drosera capensis]
MFPTFLPLLLVIPVLLIARKLFTSTNQKIVTSQSSSTTYLPKSYPIIGSLFEFIRNRGHILDWTSNIIQASPSSTFILHRPLGYLHVWTANPVIVEHILKTKFSIYPKGNVFTGNLEDLLGHGIFNADGQEWKFQRKVASNEFNTKSLRKFVENVVDTELSNRFIPILSDAAKKGTVLDLQDVLKRFTFDNICKIAFGYDPEFLSPSFPQEKFAVAFEQAVQISLQRFLTFFPFLWKLKRFLNIGSERRLKEAVDQVREFSRTLVRQKKKELEYQQDQSLPESDLDLLSRFLKSGHVDEQFVTDIVVSFILAGRDTTSAALTWFFWLLSTNPAAEGEILKEIGRNNEDHSVFDEVKDMVFTHAALSESMRLYPPVPVDTKEAAADDILPDGTKVKKGMRMTYHPYAMGRSEKIWGKDWPEFRPNRWLQKDPTDEGKWKFVPKDPSAYPVFQAGPRTCIGKDMAFLQMKRVVAGVLGRFKVIPVMEEGFQPVLVLSLTSIMKGGLPVRIEERHA